MDGFDKVALTTTSPLSVFVVVFQVALLGALGLSLPFLAIFAGQFLSPALMEREKRLLFPIGLGAVAFFLLGGAFAFFLIVPATIRFSLVLNRELGFTTLWTADSYFSLVVWMVLGLGATFQFPLVLLLLVKLGILSSAKLAAGRRIAFVILLIFSAIVTPTPDPVTLLLVAIPLYGLYEFSIILARMSERRARKAELDSA
jgi:sec-independent protein translocase protein TatC